MRLHKEVDDSRLIGRSLMPGMDELITQFAHNVTVTSQRIAAGELWTAQLLMLCASSYDRHAHRLHRCAEGSKLDAAFLAGLTWPTTETPTSPTVRHRNKCIALLFGRTITS